MKESLWKKMKEAAYTFRVKAGNKTDGEVSEWLSDNYYLLEQYANHAAEDCRQAEKRLRGSEVLPGLFARCAEICKNGVLPDENSLTDNLKKEGLDGLSAQYFPLACVYSLVESASTAVKTDNQKLLSESVKSLRRIQETDFDFVAENLSESEPILMKDPAEIYPLMDDATKKLYRNHVALAAFKSGKSEKIVASKALKKAENKGVHIGKFIIKDKRSHRNGKVFLTMSVVMPLATAVAAGVLFAEPFTALLLFFPLWEILRIPIEKAFLKKNKAEHLPKLLKSDSRVLITVSTLLPSAERMAELYEKMEQLFLSNGSENIKVCCLADFKAAGMPRKPEDKHALNAARNVIDNLNKKYGSGFILAVRPRSYSDTQNEFIGKERKRGAITELIRAIHGNKKGFLELYGDTEKLEEVKYLAALDWDTVPAFGAINELVAVADHPLNAPVIKNGKVVSGYGVFVPKTENSLSSRVTTVFSRLMSGDSGFAGYDSASVEKYFTLFSESVFCGKGLINVEAYYKTLDKSLPRERILSHDIVESGYLRAAYVADVQFTESFPKSVGAYFRRLHRWVRGDWQNIGFIFGKNPLNYISRFKMFDNLRRSLHSAFCIGSILASAVIQGNAGVAVTVVSALALAADNIFSAFQALKSGVHSVTRLSFSGVAPSALGSFIRAFANQAFSAKEAFVCIDAAIKALWRLFVSGNNLLEWETAANSEKHDSTYSHLISCLPSIAVSAVLLAFGLPIHRLVGIILLADIPLTVFSGTQIRRKSRRLSKAQREDLFSYSGAMWDFFEDLCGRENNFLAPDNIQFSPVRAVAQRTSPTNIGLMLASFLAARDFGFISSAELYMRLNLSLTTVEKLEKYKGNLLNWYSTETLESLTPRFVSAVDSGNFLCSLVALKEGLKEYLPECAALGEIIKRIEKIIKETDLSDLYNRRRKLFYVGVNPDSGEKSGSCYDFYMSEMRMTSYFAVASKLVSANHWNALSRMPVSSGRYAGLASWTGTAFEYFMPEIFLPSPEGSLSSEAMMFCLYCQKKRAGKLPFGISESGFFAFDSSLNYQYKAHGVQTLGLKRGLDSETVISPYSSFLMMQKAPSMSVKNLKRLEKMGAFGKYGFFEAADFTKGRKNGKFSVVRSFMAHHVGMSLLSADNALNANCMQKRFMRDSLMKGAATLLEENGLINGKPFKGIKENPETEIRERTSAPDIVSDNPNPFFPQATVYSNGSMTEYVTDIGTAGIIFNGVNVTVADDDPIDRPQGVFAVFSSENVSIPFVKSLNRTQLTDFGAEFSNDAAFFKAKRENTVLEMQVSLLKKQNCSVRTFTVENKDRKSVLKGKLTVYFEPCLDKRDSFAAHPAFSKLFVVDEWNEENNCFVFSRRQREKDVPIAVAAGFDTCDSTVNHESDRERVLTTPKGVFSLGEKTNFEGKRGNPDCCCAFSVDIELKPNEKIKHKFFVVAEDTVEQAVDTFALVKHCGGKEKLSENPFSHHSAEFALSKKLLPHVLYPRVMSSPTSTDEVCDFGKEDLWRFGISGDLPIVICKISEDDYSSAIPYIRVNKILRNCGIETDLGVIYCDKNSYSTPLADSLKKIIESEGCSLMIGVKGGVHLINSACFTPKQTSVLEKYPCFVSDSKSEESNNQKKTFYPLKTVMDADFSENAKRCQRVKQYNLTNKKICIKKNSVTVDIPWTLVLANKNFGTMVSDKALGFTWAINSRENKLTPWYNDTMSDNRGELLYVKYKGVLYDIISLGEAVFTPEKAFWKATVENLSVEVTVTVPKRGMSKKISVELSAETEKNLNVELMYYVLPVLDESRRKNGVFFIKKHKNALVIQNSDSDTKGYMSVFCDDADLYCVSRKNFFEGSFDCEIDKIPQDCCAATGRRITVNGKEKIDFCLSWGATEKAALLMPEVARFEPDITNPYTIRTKDKNLDLFFNSFLYTQIKYSRFFGRTGFYQCSGAYGFRDQLQDSLAFIDLEPVLTFRHIIRCAAAQFVEGDVLHWWHVSVNKKAKIRGIRTRCSDDMLWLPYVCCVYSEKTGDRSIFDVEVPYIKGEELNPNESERYFEPERTDFRESVLQHCIKAVDRSLNFGKNGLPLMGSCDWNDGFNKIGITEKSESVWLGMFQKIVLNKFAVILKDAGMSKKAEEYLLVSKKIEASIIEKATEKDRFSRLLHESGEPMRKEEDYIDILPQAFSVFADIGNKEMQIKVLNTAYEKLFDEENGVIKLLGPPFTEETRNIGYIASYPEGIRENAGQYTHAAVWLAMALYKSGQTDKAEKLIKALNPISFYLNDYSAAQYRAEPYVLSGDILTAKDIIGRAGWNHFTGSAAWFYRFVADCAKENGELINSEKLSG